MGTNSPVLRPIRVPPPDLATRSLPRTRQHARSWFRIHPTIYSAIHFSLMPRHRFSHPNCPGKILYVALDPETCFWECFGDNMFDHGRSLPKTQWEDASISQIEVPALHLCDLSKTRTRSAIFVDLTALMSADLTIPQAWGLAIQNHPAQVPAIKFKSRFTGTACLAIFEQGCGPGQLKAKKLGPINRFDLALTWLSKNKVSLI